MWGRCWYERQAFTLPILWRNEIRNAPNGDHSGPTLGVCADRMPIVRSPWTDHDRDQPRAGRSALEQSEGRREVSQLNLFYLPAFNGTEAVIDWDLVSGFDIGTNETLFKRWITSDYRKREEAEMRRLRNRMRGRTDDDDDDGDS